MATETETVPRFFQCPRRLAGASGMTSPAILVLVPHSLLPEIRFRDDPAPSLSSFCSCRTGPASTLPRKFAALLVFLVRDQARLRAQPLAAAGPPRAGMTITS